jgi:hypothetical protein
MLEERRCPLLYTAQQGLNNVRACQVLLKRRMRQNRFFQPCQAHPERSETSTPSPARIRETNFPGVARVLLDKRRKNYYIRNNCDIDFVNCRKNQIAWKPCSDSTLIGQWALYQAQSKEFHFFNAGRRPRCSPTLCCPSWLICTSLFPDHLYLFRKVSENYLFHCWLSWRKLDQIYRPLPLGKGK